MLACIDLVGVRAVKLVQERVDGERSVTAARRFRIERDLGGVFLQRLHDYAIREPAGEGCIHELPADHAGHDALAEYGDVPEHAEQPRTTGRTDCERELRARADAAVHDGARPAE